MSTCRPIPLAPPTSSTMATSRRRARGASPMIWRRSCATPAASRCYLPRQDDFRCLHLSAGVCLMRVILITGASSGIGAATARTLAAPDTAIALHARKNRAGLEKVAGFVRGAGAEALILEGDLAGT